MRRLFPDPTDHVNLEGAYRASGRTGRHLRVNMVSSVDGAAAVAGRVGALSGTADDHVLHVLRALADVVVVGAGTIRAEGYGPGIVPADMQQRRRDRGEPAVPQLAVITRRVDLDLSAPLFTAAISRPLIITTTRAPAHRLTAATDVADVITAGDDRVDLASATAALAGRGLTRILCEGGPHLLAQLYAADQVDELCLTISPMVTCGTQPRITAGPPLSDPAALVLAHVLEQDQFLFLRYTRR